MKLAHNSFYNLMSTLVPAVLSIVTIPFFVAQIGPERYGTLAIAWLLLGYFGAADFGIGRAITQRISTMRGAEHAALANAVWSALVSVLVFAIFGAFLLWLLATWYFGEAFVVGQSLRSEMLAAVWLLALCNPVNSISGVLAGSLMGLERFRLVAASNGLANSLALLFPLATAYLLSTDVAALVASALVGRALGAVLLGWGVWHTFLRTAHPVFDRLEFMRLANFGAWITVSSLVGPLMLYADRLMVGAIQNAVAVAAYAIPYQIGSRLLILPTALMQALFPRFAAEEAETSRAHCRNYTIFAVQSFTPVIVVLICLAGPLMQLWLGDTLDRRSIWVGQILLAGFWVNAAAFVPFAFIQARGDPRFTALLHLAELPFYMAVLAISAHLFGLAGFALAFSLRCAVDCTLLLRRAGTLDSALLAVVAPALLLVLAALLACYLLEAPLALLSVAGLLGGLAILLWLLQMPEAIRERLAELPLLGRLLDNRPRQAGKN